LATDEQISTPLALNNAQSSIQSASISMVVAHPEGVKLRSHAQAFLAAHATAFGAVRGVGVRVAAEDPNAPIRANRRASSVRPAARFRPPGWIDVGLFDASSLGLRFL
jgi:hypothetical protein